MNQRKLLILWMLFLALGVQAQCIFVKSDVRQSMRRVADWQIAHSREVVHGQLNWVNATFYLGLSRWAAIAETENGDGMYYEWLRKLGARNYWQVDQRMYHADDVCVAQMYLDLYRKYGRQEMLIPSQARIDWVISHPSKGSFALDYGDASTLERWTWCDALFMAPPVYARLYSITGDKKYLRFMDREYRATYDHLFDREEHLFYRDHRYIGQKEANGRKVFWGRGNGWVIGGLVEILRELPRGHKSRPFYENLFVEMCERLVGLQRADGFWSASLLDPESYPSPETSGTGFYVYGLAYGVNEGLLSRERFLPAVEKGWKALLSAVEEDGRLGYVQPVGADPRKVARQMTEPYGPGAFLLAGTEIYRMAAGGGTEKNISSERVREIAAMLPDKPQGLGLTYKNREHWNQLLQTPEGQNILKLASESLEKGMPPFVDSLYLHLNKTEIRLPGENMMNARYQYLWRLVLAECMENKKRFLPAIIKGMEELCRQKPWSIPAHDRDLRNYNGTDYYVDLVVATAGNTFAQCVRLLDDRLPIETRALVNCAFREKVFRPIRRCLEETKPFYWFTVKNNWNSVCLAGVTGAALALLPDKEERAYFVAAAEKYQSYGMEGYADDGYCREGVGYYNYGFGAFITLREEVCRATQGQIDFFRLPKFVRLARYGEKIQIQNRVCPAYSDCRIGISPDTFVTDYCNRALGLETGEETCSIPPMDNLSLHFISMFPHQAWPVEMTPEMNRVLEEESDPLHACYEMAGIVIARPVAGSSCRLGVSFKAGHNDDSHNHNDVGSFVVVQGDQTMAGDMGGPFSYPGDFFSDNAYRYPIKNSYGHPVPVVDGKWQDTGRKAEGKVLERRLSDSTDVCRLDLKSAYSSVEGLDRLERAFAYDRREGGSFVVEDVFECAKPVSFETALTTRAQWKVVSGNCLELSSGNEKMQVWIESSAPVSFTSDTVEVNSPAYSRIGIVLKGKSGKGYIRMKMMPVKK